MINPSFTDRKRIEVFEIVVQLADTGTGQSSHLQFMVYIELTIYSYLERRYEEQGEGRVNDAVDDHLAAPNADDAEHDGDDPDPYSGQYPADPLPENDRPFRRLLRAQSPECFKKMKRARLRFTKKTSHVSILV
jgi:hypothetical protein